MTAALVFPASAPDDRPQCGGAVYRYRQTTFATRGGVKSTWELLELKRQSCAGCGQCDSIRDEMREFPDLVELDPMLQNGDTARLSVVVDSTDWETGHADDWHVLATRVAP